MVNTVVFKKHTSFTGLYQLENVNQSTIQPQIFVGLSDTINELKLTIQLESRLIIVSVYKHRSYCLFETKKLLFCIKLLVQGQNSRLF